MIYDSDAPFKWEMQEDGKCYICPLCGDELSEDLECENCDAFFNLTSLGTLIKEEDLTWIN